MANRLYIQGEEKEIIAIETTCILTIVKVYPRQLIRVKAVPVIAGGAALATSVENSGESVITAIPQRHINSIKILKGSCIVMGNNRQHTKENDNAKVAIFLGPYF